MLCYVFYLFIWVKTSRVRMYGQIAKGIELVVWFGLKKERKKEKK